MALISGVGGASRDSDGGRRRGSDEHRKLRRPRPSAELRARLRHHLAGGFGRNSLKYMTIFVSDKIGQPIDAGQLPTRVVVFFDLFGFSRRHETGD